LNVLPGDIRVDLAGLTFHW